MSKRPLPELIFGCDEEVAAWVADRVEQVDVSDFLPCAAIGVATGGRLLAGVVFHDYQSKFDTMQLSMAADSPLWARREIIHQLLSYPFRQLGVHKVWTAIPLEGEAALKVNKHIGFKREAVLGHHLGPGKHCVMMRMLEPDFKRIFEHG